MHNIIASISIILCLFFNLNFNNYVIVSHKPSPIVLELGKKAWEYQHKIDPSLKPIITIVDFSKSDRKTRLWVINIKTNEILFSSLVAHGSGSGGEYATRFSNEDNSHMSSIGVYVTQETYFGKHGLSLKINGLDKGWNDHARSRSIVVHGSDYVNPDYVGHSWGCFAVSQSVSSKLIHLIKNNTMIFAYYPDSHYFHTSKFFK